MPGGAGAPSLVRRGDLGQAVAEVRARLADLGLLTDSGTDAGFPAREAQHDEAQYDEAVERAVRAFQQQRGLTADGIVGRETFRALEEACWRLGDRVLVHRPGDLLAGDDVIALQRRLLDLGFKVGRVDGRFGAATEQAVREFQRNIGVPPDGTCGPATLKALARLTPRVQGGSPNALRAEETIRRAGPRLAGKVVVVDAAPSTAEDARVRRGCEDIASDLARRVEGRLVATGVQAYLSASHAGRAGDEADRAEFANRAGANLCVSLAVEPASRPADCGCSAYYWGIEAHGVRSSVGERFAGLLQREIVARTGLVDLRTHARSWELLRRTRMPAVRVDLDHAEGAAPGLGEPGFRDVVAEAVVVAVQRLYLAPEVDAHTGVLRLDDVRALQRREG